MEEAEAAYAWYAEQNPAAAELFLIDLDVSVARVQELPETWPRLRRGNYRRFVFRRFSVQPRLPRTAGQDRGHRRCSPEATADVLERSIMTESSVMSDAFRQAIEAALER